MRRVLVAFVVGLLAPILGVIVLACLGMLPVRATANPSWLEATLARRAVHARLSRDASGLKNPAPPTEETLRKGMKLYRNGCAGCHGQAGRPSRWGSSNFYPRVPQFAETPPALTAPETFLAVKHGIRYA